MTEDAAQVLTAAKLLPGDYVAEYGATVESVAESVRRSGLREVTFDGQPGTFYLISRERFTVTRRVAGDSGRSSASALSRESLEKHHTAGQPDAFTSHAHAADPW